MDKPNNVEHNISKELAAIINTPPNWTTRWGLTIISITFLLLLIASVFVKIPTKFVFKASLYSLEQPVKIILNNSLNYQNIYAKNLKTVKKGDTLFVEKNLKNSSKKSYISPIFGTIVYHGYTSSQDSLIFYIYPFLKEFYLDIYVPIEKFDNVRKTRYNNMTFLTDNIKIELNKKYNFNLIRHLNDKNYKMILGPIVNISDLRNSRVSFYDGEIILEANDESIFRRLLNHLKSTNGIY